MMKTEVKDYKINININKKIEIEILYEYKKYYGEFEKSYIKYIPEKLVNNFFDKYINNAKIDKINENIFVKINYDILDTTQNILFSLKYQPESDDQKMNYIIEENRYLKSEIKELKKNYEILNNITFLEPVDENPIIDLDDFIKFLFKSYPDMKQEFEEYVSEGGKTQNLYIKKYQDYKNDKITNATSKNFTLPNDIYGFLAYKNCIIYEINDVFEYYKDNKTEKIKIIYTTNNYYNYDNFELKNSISNCKYYRLDSDNYLQQYINLKYGLIFHRHLNKIVKIPINISVNIYINHNFKTNNKYIHINNTYYQQIIEFEKW